MIILKTPAEIEVMAEAGRRLAEILAVLESEVKAGVKTLALDERSKELIKKAGCTPAFLGYSPGGAHRPFPSAICVSVNDVVVHGVPSEYVIQEGDLVKLDFGLVWNGFYADAAVTVAVGNVDPRARELVHTTEAALEAAIREARPGRTLGDIGWVIEEAVRAKKFSVADTLTGHGIGRALHEDPWVMNTGRPGKGEKLEAGMVLAIEPMVNMGGSRVRQGRDDSYITADGSLSAHFEHTVAITENGPQVLTRRR